MRRTRRMPEAAVLLAALFSGCQGLGSADRLAADGDSASTFASEGSAGAAWFPEQEGWLAEAKFTAWPWKAKGDPGVFARITGFGGHNVDVEIGDEPAPASEVLCVLACVAWEWPKPRPSKTFGVRVNVGFCFGGVQLECDVPTESPVCAEGRAEDGVTLGYGGISLHARLTDWFVLRAEADLGMWIYEYLGAATLLAELSLSPHAALTAGWRTIGLSYGGATVQRPSTVTLEFDGLVVGLAVRF